jgi:flavorubredoxin
VIGAIVNLNDFSDRPPRGMVKGDILTTGKYRFRFHPTPHLPHGWDAGALFEETQGILFCSDLFHQVGEREAVTESVDVLDRTREAMNHYQAGPLMEYLPYTPHTSRLLHELASLAPKTLAIMHGSSFTGDGGRMLRELDPIFQNIYGERT